MFIDERYVYDAPVSVDKFSVMFFDELIDKANGGAVRSLAILYVFELFMHLNIAVNVSGFLE